MRRKTILRVAGDAAAGVQAAWGGARRGEPETRVRVVRHRIAPADWPRGLPPLTIACIADPHIGGPDTPPELLERLVERTNALAPDMVALLGDYGADHRIAPRGRVGMAEVAAILAELRAPLGVHAVLGNHDWWEDPDTQGFRRKPLPEAAEAFARAGLPVLHNAQRLVHHAGRPVRVAGLGSQWAYYLRRGGHRGADDIERTLDGAGDGAPTILLAHEPDIFPGVPEAVAVTLAGHTHGGQVRMGRWAPVVPSRFGNRYAYGHVEEAGRHLVVSGGIGSSLMPIRLGVPPEITLVELASATASVATLRGGRPKTEEMAPPPLAAAA
jgi:uncharacterized protein